MQHKKRRYFSEEEKRRARAISAYTYRHEDKRTHEEIAWWLRPWNGSSYDTVPVESVPRLISAGGNFLLEAAKADVRKCMADVRKHTKALAAVETGEFYALRELDYGDLGPRSLNCLSRDGVTKVGQLVLKSEEDLLSIKHFGRKSLKEVKDFLSDLGLGLADAT